MTTTIRELPLPGPWTIAVIIRGGSPLAIDHLERLTQREYDRVINFLEQTSRTGPLGYTDEKSKKLSADIFELKPLQAVRLPYFYDGPRHIVITHAFTKKKRRTDREEIVRAETLRAEYLEGRVK